jgi:CheY-like chemotaxis protein
MDTLWNICCAIVVCATWFRAGWRNDRSAAATPPAGSSTTKGRAGEDPVKGKLPAPNAGTALRILAVDDEPSIAACLSLIFERPRYELTSARNGNDALARLSAAPAPFDVVITDNEMPHVSGIELVRKLRERSFRGKIIVLSGYLTNETRQAYAQMKVDAILDKPFDNYDLRNRLDLLVA